jgi:hypothetical protein
VRRKTDEVVAGHLHKVGQIMSGQSYLREEVDLDSAIEYAVSAGVWRWFGHDELTYRHCSAQLL